MTAPELKTARLRLRGWNDADRREWPNVVGDPAVMQFLAPHRPLTSMEAGEQVDRLRAAWAVHEIGHWAVEELATTRLLGRLGLERHPDWDLDPAAVEVGWILRRDAWGRGYATEGGEAALRFAFEEVGLGRVISISHPGNRASLGVMEKLGFVRAGFADWRGQDVVWYELSAAAWSVARSLET
jgi:RimJ/RimL family protein N-acetyltransferase